MVVSPSSTGDLEIPFTGQFGSSDDINVSILVTAESTNGTFAGSMELNFSLEVKNEQPSNEPQFLIIALIVISALIAIVGVIIFITLGKMGYHFKTNEKVEKEDEVQEDGVADGK